MKLPLLLNARYLAAGLVLALLIPTWAAGAEFPDRTVRIVVPYPPGSADALVRVLGERLSKKWKQPVVIENKPGASAIVGTDYVAKAQHDGYTLLATSDSPITSNPHIFVKLPYNALRDFVPITQLIVSNMVFVATPSLAVTNLKDVVAMAKASPGKLTYGSWGEGSQAFLAFEALKKSAGVDIVQIPYQGVVPAAVATMTGEVNVTLASPTFAINQIAAGKLKAIASTYPSTVPTLATVPSLSVLGLEMMDPTAWIGIFAPSDTPTAIVYKIQEDIAEILGDPVFLQREIESKGWIPGGMSPDAFSLIVKADYERKGRLLSTLGIKLK